MVYSYLYLEEKCDREHALSELKEKSVEDTCLDSSIRVRYDITFQFLYEKIMELKNQIQHNILPQVTHGRN